MGCIRGEAERCQDALGHGGDGEVGGVDRHVGEGVARRPLGEQP
jgi:hypothetical protein